MWVIQMRVWCGHMKQIKTIPVRSGQLFGIKGVPLGLLRDGYSSTSSDICLLVEQWDFYSPSFEVKIVATGDMIENDFEYMMTLEFYTFKTDHEHLLMTSDIEVRHDYLNIPPNIGGPALLPAVTTAPTITIRGRTSRPEMTVDPVYHAFHLYAKPD